jgi:hypothetical protein
MKPVGYDVMMKARGSAMWGAHHRVEHALIIKVMFGTFESVSSMIHQIVGQQVKDITCSQDDHIGVAS